MSLSRFTSLSRPFLRCAAARGRAFASSAPSYDADGNLIPFKGIMSKEFVKQPSFKNSYEGIPILRQLKYDGTLVQGVELPFSLDQGVEMYKVMLRLGVYDQILYDIQRQGRISFYMTNTGEEAAQVGSGSALTNDDMLFPQYRELGVLLTRGFTLKDILDQCFSTGQEPGKGRQMPIHYTSKRHNIQTISSPLATQIPHAAGAGYAYRIANKKQVAVAYFGEGAASEGDFCAAINMAATLRSQTLFICRNNGFAISTPVHEQYIGDGIAVRGVAYGMDSIRVDGNDIIAVFNAVKDAREKCIREGKPILVELMTYRVGHHSTSDDASRYRQDEEAKAWMEEGMSGVGRFKRFLVNQGVWTTAQDLQVQTQTRKEVLQMIKEVETKQKAAPIDEMFTDVYDELPWNLKEQRRELQAHLDKHGGELDVSFYETSKDFPVEKYAAMKKH